MRTISIIEKALHPVFGNFRRTYYYTYIKFRINKKLIKITAKIDTGATRTIIGLGLDSLSVFKGIIIRDGIQGKPAYDASSTEIDTYLYEVEDFSLTEEIIFPKLQIYFSENIGEKAIIGMDMLSLFDFSYRKGSKSTNGVFTIHNYQETLDRLFQTNFYKEFGYIMPDMVLALEDTILGLKS